MVGRPCGPCGDKQRNELDRRLLEMGTSGETFRSISQEFGYSEYALSRHLKKHLSVDLATIKQSKELARQKAIEEAHAAELEKAKADIETTAKADMATRLDNAANYLDKLKVIQQEAAKLLDKAEQSDDLKASASFLKELREQIRLWAELDGKLASQPKMNILVNPEWTQLRTLIINALEPYPEAREAVVNAIHK